MRFLKKILRFFLKTILVLMLVIIATDVVISYIRYRNYYEIENATHPTLGSSHDDYVMGYSDTLSSPLQKYPEKVKLLYWHTGCPASFSWFPTLEKFANGYPDALEVFIITDQTKRSLSRISNGSNIHLVSGKVRWEEPRFKHSSSSHLVVLDQENVLRAYGYQLKETNEIINQLVEGRKIDDALSQHLEFEEKRFQSSLANINNLSFKLSGYNPAYKSYASRSTQWADYKNFSIGRIYSFTFDIPLYRIIDNTSRNIRSEEEADLYNVYYKTQAPFRPFTWQLIFDDEKERREKFVTDLYKRLDNDLGLQSTVKVKETEVLVLEKIIPTKDNQFKAESQRKAEAFEWEVSDSDSSQWTLRTVSSIKNLVSLLENKIEMPVISTYNKRDKYSLKMRWLSSDQYSMEEVIADLEKQGFVFSTTKTEVKYLEIEEASDNNILAKGVKHDFE